MSVGCLYFVVVQSTLALVELRVFSFLLLYSLSVTGIVDSSRTPEFPFEQLCFQNNNNNNEFFNRIKTSTIIKLLLSMFVL